MHYCAVLKPSDSTVRKLYQLLNLKSIIDPLDLLFPPLYWVRVALRLGFRVRGPERLRIGLRLGFRNSVGGTRIQWENN